VSHAIQLSVAPVSLPSAIAAMLAVMTNRLARIVDRARAVHVHLASASADERAAAHGDLAALSQRALLPARDLHRDREPAHRPAVTAFVL
jgi:uncharacterized protein DUF2721